MLTGLKTGGRSREGRDEEQYDEELAARVSIHAPAKGATKKLRQVWLVPARFNPCAREGCDKRVSIQSTPLEASIHAAARDATPGNYSELPKSWGFTHALARGVTGVHLKPISP